MSRAPKNTLGGRTRTGGIAAFMTPMVILALVIIGVFSLGALITLSGFADDLRDTNNGQAHALSSSAIGYAGIVELMRADGTDVTLDRREFETADTNGVLRVITLTRPSQMPDADEIDASVPTLIVMPKWIVTPVRERRGWVKRLPRPSSAAYSPSSQTRALEKIVPGLSLARIKDADDNGTLIYDMETPRADWPIGSGFNIRYLQTLEGETLSPLVSANGKAVVARKDDTNLFIISDPDFLNTQGISQKSRARFARDLIHAAIGTSGGADDEVIFDLSVHGFGSTQNLVKMMLTPPFLAATLCLLAAGGLIAWQAFVRFGDPARQERDYALGKFTLADNGARFISIAGKETTMGEGYSALIRRQAAKDFYMDQHSQDAIAEFFDAREQKTGAKNRWRAITARLHNTTDVAAFLAAARALYAWRQEITDDSQ